VLTAVAFATIGAASGATAQTGTVQGLVRDAATGRGLPSAQVSIAGQGLGGLTNADGRFLILNVPIGEQTVQVTLIGHATQEQSATVQAGSVTTVDFQLSTSALELDEVVVTGTAGGTQRRAIGNVVTNVVPDQVLSRSPIQSVDQLIGQRTPGLVMMPGTGQVGTGTAPRIRGVSSVTQGNDPIIYLDGVRMDSDPRRGPGQRGGSNISRLNDIHPADIESIEIIKGPAAATLYGTEASNGVIQIITKRGRTGAPQFDLTARLGTNWLWDPAGRVGLRYMPDPDNPDELLGINVYELEEQEGLGPIFQNGLTQSYNLSVRGGTDAVRYFGSVSRDDDVGVVDWNWSKRLALRANIEALLSPTLTVNISTAFIASQIRLAQGTIDTDPFSNLIWSNPRTLVDGSGRRGWRAAPPEEWSKVEDRGDSDRTTNSVELRYHPFEWLSHRLVAGVDNNAELEFSLLPQQPEGASHYYGQRALGDKQVQRGTRRFITVDYSGSANVDWRNYTFTPSVGFQYYKTQSSFITAEGSEFPAIPVTTISGGAVRTGDESFAEEAMVGFYVQQQVGWNNRAFLTAALRMDSHSAFGSDIDAAYYPKLSGAWVISEESFWNVGWVDQFRLRGAWGAAGQQPGTFAASRLYGPTIGYGDSPALQPDSYGNPDLKPERGEELELGFDASFLSDRIGVEFTRYSRKTKDAIINQPLPPSSGFTGSQLVNIGQIDGWGNELAVDARLVQGSNFSWEIDTQLATMDNEIVSLGGDLEAIFAGTQSQHREGYSVSDIFMLRVLEAEIDEDGAVTSATCDGGTGPQGVDPGGAPVPCADAPQVWLGKSQPTWQVGFGSAFTFFNNFRFYARVEGNGGHIQNNTEIRATHNQSTTEAVLLHDNPLVQAYRSLENDRMGIYEAGFLRLREVSVSYDLPGTLAGAIGARRGTLSVGARNLAMLWTAEEGWGTPRSGLVTEKLAGMHVWDPEVRATGANSVGYQTVLPPTASFTMTLRLSF
jgi:TonB-linked SusC/RagA family outer membrane protein